MKKVEIQGYTHAELADKTATFGFLKIAHDGALIRAEGEHLEVSDGYHTFDELYEHRIELWIAVCRLQKTVYGEFGGVKDFRAVWRSKLHSDGTGFDGWFILGIRPEARRQITYHLPISRWDDTDFAETLEIAPEWDGHTSDDVLNRLKEL